MTFKHGSTTYTITEAQAASIQSAYYEMCRAEDSGESGSHYQLINAFNTAGVRGLDKQSARKLAGKLF